MLPPDVAERAARRLADRFPDRDPLTIRFPDLERWLADLEGLPLRGLAPRELETIQAAWYGRFEEQRGRKPPATTRIRTEGKPR